jgi:hypothetical protein
LAKLSCPSRLHFGLPYLITDHLVLAGLRDQERSWCSL